MKIPFLSRLNLLIGGTVSSVKRGHSFEDARVYPLNFWHFKKGAAMTIPGIGIFVDAGKVNNIDLLRHEYGHILQYRKWGARAFWFSIAPTSLKSSYQAHKNPGFRHMDTWTEWSANRLAYHYFKQPPDWNMQDYPLEPSSLPTGEMPPFVAALSQESAIIKRASNHEIEF